MVCKLTNCWMRLTWVALFQFLSCAIPALGIVLHVAVRLLLQGTRRTSFPIAKTVAMAGMRVRPLRTTGILRLSLLSAAVIAWMHSHISATSDSFVALPRSSTRSTRTRARAADPGDCAGVREEAITGVILPAMDKDEPDWLGMVLARYLDDEWTTQDAHWELGKVVADMYQESREEGDDEVTAVLAKLSLGLKTQFERGMWGDLFEGP
eukprot:1905885-Amphidinium_carterae.1